MLKSSFASLALVAMLGLVVAAPLEDPEEIEGETQSNLSLLPALDANIAQLDGAQAMFIDYCKEMLTFVTDRVRDEGDSVKSQVFNVIFTTGEQVAADTLDSGNRAVEQLAKRLRDPNLPLDDTKAADDIQNIINQSAKNIHERTTRSDLFESAKAVLSVMASKAYQAIRENVAQVKAMVKPQAIAMLSQGCERFQKEYMTHVGKRFDEVRHIAQNAAAAEPGQVILAIEVGKTRLEELRCSVTKNMVKIRNFCSFYQAAGPVLLKMVSA